LEILYPFRTSPHTLALRSPMGKCVCSVAVADTYQQVLAV
jgi:hypothetical protein